MSEIDVSSLSAVAIEAFFDRELEAMPSVSQAYTALDDAVVKKIQLRGFAARAQYNPHRVQSSSARVDAASIKARRCFLCKANRPAGQTMLDLGTYELLVNPFPVFKRHFTIPDKRHVPQSISGRITHMGVLAQAMTGYTVFYNGPRCGASAPDHMHFQAGLSDAFSLPDVARGSALSSYAGGKCRIFAFGESPVPLFLIRSTELSALEVAFAELYSAVKSVAGCAGEPMMNILCRAVGGVVDLYVIPRKAHRPDFYGMEEGCMLLSPASVDLGGLFVVPRRNDFDRLDEDVVAGVLGQVCLHNEDFNRIKDLLK